MCGCSVSSSCGVSADYSRYRSSLCGYSPSNCGGGGCGGSVWHPASCGGSGCGSRVSGGMTCF